MIEGGGRRQRLATAGTFKRSLLLFWAAWYSVVVSSNVLDALKALAVLPSSWLFASGNFAWINDVMDPLGVPRWRQAFQFGGVIAWQGLAAGLFWVALATFRNRPLSSESVTSLALLVGTALWAAFQVLGEVFLAFGPAGVHRGIFAISLLTVMAVWVLPSDNDR